jgi:hypothetical protein
MEVTSHLSHQYFYFVQLLNGLNGNEKRQSTASLKIRYCNSSVERIHFRMQISDKKILILIIFYFWLFKS